ncbi:MAG TPA: hypothetical protein VGC39_07635 [Candidatus Methylacidiphilales bacterium]
MRHCRPPIVWTYFLAVTLVMTGRALFADDPPASADGYKTVYVDGKNMPVRVKEAGDPYKNVSATSSSGKYDPTSLNFSATSSMANKSFSAPPTTFSHSIYDLKNRDQNTFVTKPYVFDSSSHSVPNLNAKPTFASTTAYDRTAAGFDRSYQTSSADAGQNRTALLASTTSPDQGRTATFEKQTSAAFASDLAHKTFEGDEAQAAHRHLSRNKTGQIEVTELPDRPLTIDEVRDLINHGFKPNTEVKPEEPSKPLNDPDYKPQPLRDVPAPAASEDDKDDPVPAPGIMSAAAVPVENSEPLPQH